MHRTTEALLRCAPVPLAILGAVGFAGCGGGQFTPSSACDDVRSAKPAIRAEAITDTADALRLDAPETSLVDAACRERPQLTLAGAVGAAARVASAGQGDGHPTETPAPAEPDLLPAPRGPAMEVTQDEADFPYTMQGIGAFTTAQWGDEPAPAGKKWVAVALEIRGKLKDRDMPPPDLFGFNFTWRGGCPSNYFDDPYLCNNEDLERVSDFMPVDATSLDDPRNLRSSDVIPAGQPVDVIYRALVPEDVMLTKSGIKYGIQATGGKNYLLRLKSLPTF